AAGRTPPTIARLTASLALANAATSTISFTVATASRRSFRTLLLNGTCKPVTVSVLKPGSDALTWYVPDLRLGNTYTPRSLVIAVRITPVAGFRARIVAPGITALLESETAPLRNPVPAVANRRQPWVPSRRSVASGALGLVSSR